MDPGMDFGDQVRKRVRKMSNFGSEIGSGLGEPGGTPPPRIPRNTKYPGGLNLNRVSVKLLKLPQHELVFWCRTGFSECKHLFIDKLMQLRSQVLSPTSGETLVGSGHVSPRIWEISDKHSLSLSPYGRVGENPGNEVESDDNNRARCTKLCPIIIK